MSSQNMEDKKCPCIDCLCVPVCKQKYSEYLFGDCKLLTDYCTYDNIENLLQEIDKIFGTTYYSDYIS